MSDRYGSAGRPRHNPGSLHQARTHGPLSTPSQQPQSWSCAPRCCLRCPDANLLPPTRQTVTPADSMLLSLATRAKAWPLTARSASASVRISKGTMVPGLPCTTTTLKFRQTTAPALRPRSQRAAVDDGTLPAGKAAARRVVGQLASQRACHEASGRVGSARGDAVSVEPAPSPAARRTATFAASRRPLRERGARRFEPS